MAFTDGLASPGQSGGQLFFITGQPGSGKTTLIGTISDLPGALLLILSAGGGMRALADRPEIAVREVTKWSVMREATDFLKSKASQFNWIAVDLLPEVYAKCLAEVVAEGSATKAGRATLEARGITNDRIVDLVREFRFLAESRNLNIVFTSHTTETKDDDSGMILVRANLTPGTLSTVLGIVDVAGFLQLKKGKRQLLLVGNERIWAKARKPISYGPVAEVIEDPTFAKILQELENKGQT